MSSPPPPFSLSLLGAAPPPPPDGAANSWPSLPYRRELFSLRRRGLERVEPLSRRRQKPSWVNELLCERHSGSKSISLSLSLSVSFSLSLSLSPSQGIPVHGAVSLLPMIQLFVGQGISSPVASQKK